MSDEQLLLLLLLLMLVTMFFIVFVIEANPPIQEYDGCSLNSVNCSYYPNSHQLVNMQKSMLRVIVCFYMCQSFLMVSPVMPVFLFLSHTGQPSHTHIHIYIYMYIYIYIYQTRRWFRLFQMFTLFLDTNHF